MPDYFRDFSEFLSYLDYDLYDISFKKENIAGRIDDYHPEEKRGLVIEPSNEIINNNKEYSNADYGYCYDRSTSFKQVGH